MANTLTFPTIIYITNYKITSICCNLSISSILTRLKSIKRDLIFEYWTTTTRSKYFYILILVTPSQTYSNVVLSINFIKSTGLGNTIIIVWPSKPIIKRAFLIIPLPIDLIRRYHLFNSYEFLMWSNIRYSIEDHCKKSHKIYLSFPIKFLINIFFIVNIKIYHCKITPSSKVSV